ncbi:MAG: hypothetical protein HUK25_00400 [Treponema sp.]|nr:hypothetical protein [Treponema sp.]
MFIKYRSLFILLIFSILFCAASCKKNKTESKSLEDKKSSESVNTIASPINLLTGKTENSNLDDNPFTEETETENSTTEDKNQFGKFLEEDFSELDFEPPFLSNENSEQKDIFEALSSDINETVEKRLVDSNSRLMQFSFGDELFIPEDKKGQTVLIDAAGNKAVRSYYDSSFKLIKKEIWSVPDVKNASVLRYETYKYVDDIPFEKSVFLPEKKIITRYNEKALPLRTDVYGIYSKSESSDNKELEEEYRISSSDWKYDSSDRIISETNRSWEYRNEDYSKPYSVSIKKQEYKYHDDNDMPPDYLYYEGGKLRMKTVYSKNNEWKSDMFFDSGYTVSSIYKNGQKMQDVYSLNGQIIRTVNYD